MRPVADREPKGAGFARLREAAALAADERIVLSTRDAVVISAISGAALEIGIGAITQHREAWDSAAFWTIGLPAVLVVSLLVGIYSRGTAWMGTLAVGPSQLLAMSIKSGELGNLWPLALVLGAIMSVPFLIASFIGTRLRRAVPSTD